MKRYFTAFMMAWGNFLSIPCPKKIWDNNLKKEMLSLLPIIGLIAGLLEYALCLVMRRFLCPISVSAFFLTLFAFGISGFMHADGFMDCCDAILSRRDLAERQRILKDSRVGAFAVISMILMALGTFAAFFAICEREMATLAISYTVSQKVMTILNPIALIMIPVISRATAGACVLGLKPLQTSQYAENANAEGGASATESATAAVRSKASGRSATTKNNLKRLAIGVLIIFIILLVITIIVAAKISTQAIWIYIFRLIVPTVATLLATRLFAELARRNLGGMSGDIAGFSICMGELIGYIVMAFVLSMLI